MLLLLVTAQAAELEATPHVQVRPRVEASTGKDGAEGGETAVVSQRARLGATMTRDALSVHATVQDVRAWGSESDTLGDFHADALDMHEAWFAWTGDSATLKLGRQEIALHEHRLVGNVDWTQQGRAFDGALLSLNDGPVSADLGAAVLSQAAWFESATVFLRAGPALDGATVDLVSVLDWTDGGDLRSTSGLYAKGASGIVRGRVEGYAQVQGDTFGWMAGAAGTVAPEVATRPSVTLWYDHLSGDFATLYATNHKFYGLADIAWFTTGNHVDGQGLQDAALKLAAVPVAEVKAKLDAHVFLYSEPLADAVLGQEVDLWFTRGLTDGLALATGGSVFLRASADPDLWGWLQLDAKL